MSIVKDIERLPAFFDEIKKQYGCVDWNNGRFIIALMSDYFPGSIQLRQIIKTI